MQLRRVKDADRKGYVVINNNITKDRNLSLKAKGFLLTIFALPDDWDFSIKGVESILQEGKHTVYSVINELISAGYCRRVRVYQQGKIERWEYHFVECRGAFDLLPEKLEIGFQEEGVLLPENLEQGNLEQGNLDQGFRPQYIKQEIKEVTNRRNNQSGEVRAARGTRLDEGFAVTGPMLDWAAVKVPLVDLELETEKFRNYYASVSGTRGVKLDWIAAWRTWMLKAVKEYSSNGQNKTNGRTSRPSYGEILGEYEAMFDKYRN